MSHNGDKWRSGKMPRIPLNPPFFFDIGAYFQRKGFAFLSEDYEPQKERITVEAPSVSPVFAEYVAEELERIISARILTEQKKWKAQEINPELEVGETKTETLFGKWESVSYEGIEFHLPSEDNKLQVPRVPNCGEIEQKTKPLYTCAEDPTSVEFFDALYKMWRSFGHNPQAKWIKWIPLLIEFLIDNLSITDSGDGEIRITELLSIFKSLRDEKKQLLTLLSAEHLELIDARKRLKRLYALHRGQFKP